ncbi:MAG: metal-sensitive transcriptional regulator [Bryobacteraceae bacterium]|nr:metal-sensitive transcriptional regulator [Bryobacteraceae bacterium]
MAKQTPINAKETPAPLDVIDGCGCAPTELPSLDGKRAVAVSPDAKAANLRRLRRLEGQVRGLHKMVEDDRYCPDIMIQISAAQEALRTVGRELMRNHLRHCVTQTVAEGHNDKADAMYDELVELIYKHSR